MLAFYEKKIQIKTGGVAFISINFYFTAFKPSCYLGKICVNFFNRFSIRSISIVSSCNRSPAMARIVCEDELSLDLSFQVYHNLSDYGCNCSTTCESSGRKKMALSHKKGSLSTKTQSEMWGSKRNGLCLDRLDRLS